MAEAGKVAQQTLAQAVLARLSPDDLKQLQKWRWHDRLVSLWAPVTVLAVVFALYLTVVEFAVCTYLWLQPAMQGLGLLCFGWWLVLLVLRTPLAKRWNQVREARYRAEEILAEVESLARQARAHLKDKAWDDLVGACEATVRSFGKPLADVQGASKALGHAYDKHLKHHKRGWLDLGGGFVKALAVALAFRAVLLDPFKIPSGSMIPTLELGDQIFVNKFIYGVRLPFTDFVPFVIVRPPKRGDVIVFNNPVNPQYDYIKRVVGVPGDTLDFTEEGLVINGQLAPRTLENEQYRFWEHNEVQVTSLSTLGYWLSTWTTDDWSQRPEGPVPRELRGRASPDPRRACPPAEHAGADGGQVGQGARRRRLRDGRQPQQLARQPLRPQQPQRQPGAGVRAFRQHQGQGHGHLVLALPRRLLELDLRGHRGPLRSVLHAGDDVR